MPLIPLAKMMLEAILYTVVDPFFWLVILLVSLMNRRNAQLAISLYGRTFRPPLLEDLESLLYGILGGLLGSAILVGLGVRVDQAGIGYLWPVALVLLLINPRFMCFSYAGGIISFTSLLFGFPKVSVPSILALVAALHLVESALMYVTAGRGATPVFVKHGRGEVVGGFIQQKFWPLPLLVLTLSAGLPGNGGGALPMPDWWPLFRGSAALSNDAVFLLTPVVAALGYSELAVTMAPRQRGRRSAVALFLYSLILLLIAVLAVSVPAMAWIGALFSPLGHEGLIQWNRRREKQGTPLYRCPERGVMVLAAIPGSPAAKMGMGPGTVLLTVNGMEIRAAQDLAEVLRLAPGYLFFTALDAQGKARTFEYHSFPQGITELGAVLVSPFMSGSFVEFGETSLLHRFQEFLRKRGIWPFC